MRKPETEIMHDGEIYILVDHNSDLNKELQKLPKDDQKWVIITDCYDSGVTVTNIYWRKDLIDKINLNSTEGDGMVG